MARTVTISQHLWWVTSLWLVAACGRLGFDDSTRTDDASVPPGGPQIEVSPSYAAITECGITPVAGGLEVKNTGGSDLVISEATTTGGFTITDSLPITLASGESRNLSIIAPAAVVGTDLPDAKKAGQLVLATNADQAIHTVELEATVMGATFELVDDLGVHLLHFDGASGACPTSRPLTLKNTGNRPVNASLQSATLFSFTGFGDGVVNPGDSVVTDVNVVTSSQCVDEEHLLYVITGPLCEGGPVEIKAEFDIQGSSSCFCS
ncbi:MAG: hypothetical protein ABI867_24560 [Kofleriaceae bacterium]